MITKTIYKPRPDDRSVLAIASTERKSSCVSPRLEHQLDCLT
jgi:hypothetical protein